MIPSESPKLDNINIEHELINLANYNVDYIQDESVKI